MKKKYLPYILAVLVAMGLVVGYFGIKNAYPGNEKKVVENIEIEKNNQIICISEGLTDISNWNLYTNEKYGYEIRYPKTWEYRVNREEEVVFLSLEQVHYSQLYPNLKQAAFSIRSYKTLSSLSNWISAFERKTGGSLIKKPYHLGIYTYQQGMGDGISTIFFQNDNKNIITELSFSGDICSSYEVKLVADSFSFIE